jgi:hypothetical protein
MSPDEISAENQKRRTLITKYKSKKTKLIKDPSAPKRPLTAYLRYFLENRDVTIATKDAASQSAARWRTLSDAEKRVPPLT